MDPEPFEKEHPWPKQDFLEYDMRQPWVAALTAMAMGWIAGPTLAKDTTIVIGCTDDLSALVAEAGNDSLHAVKLAIAEANAAGGVKEEQIKLVIYDGKVDPQLTSTFVTRAIEDDGAVAIFGGNVSGAAPGWIIIANEQHVPVFGMSAATDLFTNPSTPYYFCFGPSNSRDAAAVVTLVQQSGFKRVAIINNSLPSGLDGAKAISAALKERDVEVAIIVWPCPRWKFVLELFPGLAERATQGAATLSCTEQQMVAMARALMPDPQLLLLDEPTLGLAPLITDSMFEALERLRREGLTLLLVEQRADAALALPDYAYVIATREVVGEGPAEQLRADDERAPPI
jgi:ABC-type branched-subunit amino acid transport system substrate-binding protein